MKKILNLMLYLFSPLWQYYKYLNLSKVLTIKKITKSGVYLFEQPDGKDRLYVLKLEGQQDRFLSLDFEALKKTARHDTSSQLNYFFVKQRDYQMGYIATFSKTIATELADDMGIKICNTTETIKFLLDTYNINNYEVDKKTFTLKPSININDLDKSSLFDPFYYNFSTILKDGAYLQNENYEMYQVVKYSNKKSFNYKNTFRSDFNGVYSMFIDLSDKGLKYKVDDYLAYAKRADRKIAPDIEKLQQQDKMSNLDAVLVNSIIICDNEREAYNTAGAFGLEIVKKDGLDKLEILKKSFLLTRELDYDCIVPISNVNSMVGIRTRKNLSVSDVKALEKAWTEISVDFYGKNIYDGFVNFCFRANENPHSVLIADTGTGKSVTLQKILSSILRIDYEKETVGRWDNVKTRYFEIGGSSAQLQSMLKRLYPDDVGIIEGSLENMKFSITDVKTVEKLGETEVDKDSLGLSIKLLNVILSESGEAPLTATEQSKYEDAIKSIYKDGAYKVKTISEIRRLSSEAYSEFLEKFDEKGYTGTTRISEIEDCGDISNLLKPTLDDVIALLKNRSSSTDISTQDKRAYDDLILKLEAIRGIESGLYGALSSLVLNDKSFYSFEFNKIKKNQALLRSIFSFLFITIYEQDVQRAIEAKARGEKMKQTMYIFEEARNFVEGNEEIVKMLKSAVFEGRKFQIHALFIAQMVEHLPHQIVVGSSTFFFLMPEGKEKRENLKAHIMKLFPSDSTKYLLENIEFRMLGIISSQGVYSCRLDITPKELEMFAV